MFEPALRSLRFGGRLAATFNNLTRVEFNPGEEIVKQLHVSGSPAYSGTRPTRARLRPAPSATRPWPASPPAVKTWPLENSVEANQAVPDGSAGIKQVLLPMGGGPQRDSRSVPAPQLFPRIPDDQLIEATSFSRRLAG